MDVLFVIAIFAVLVELFSRVFFGGTNLAGAVGGLFTGLRTYGWPVGIQEEDRDHRWGRRADPAALTKPGTDIHPVLLKVNSVTRPR